MRLAHSLFTAFVVILSSPAWSQSLEFSKLREQMARTYPLVWGAKVSLSLMGTAKDGNRTIVYMRVPEEPVGRWTLADCLPLNEGGWMCMLSHTAAAENIRGLPLLVK
jgi:hypothetical protein